MEPQEAPPALFHSLHQKKSSVLSLAADMNYIYSGSQGEDILVSNLWGFTKMKASRCGVNKVWDKHSFKLKTTLHGHTGSVLALEYAPEPRWLFSASGAHMPLQDIGVTED
jgi:di- and tripeptidase